jgi:hypothetical protein
MDRDFWNIFGFNEDGSISQIPVKNCFLLLRDPKFRMIFKNPRWTYSEKYRTKKKKSSIRQLNFSAD